VKPGFFVIVSGLGFSVRINEIFLKNVYDGLGGHPVIRLPDEDAITDPISAEHESIIRRTYRASYV
jgi:hypothetical protein